MSSTICCQSVRLASGVVVGWLLAVSPAAVVAQSASSDEQIVIADAQVSLIQNTFIAPPISGVVLSVDVAEGDQVEVGQLLVQLDDDQVLAELEAAESAFEAAELVSTNDVDARYAKRTLDVRQRELEQSLIANRQFPGSISETEIAKLQLVVDQSRLAIEQAEHELRVSQAKAREQQAAVKIAEARVRKHAVTAPVSGEAVEVDVQPGQWVEAGKQLVRIISQDPLRVECFVDGRRYGSELVGRDVTFTPSAVETDSGLGAADDDATSGALKGTVTFVSPELHPVTGQSRLWATIQNPARKARAGMQGSVVISAK